jgi:sulfatase modifying factor 1
MVAVLSSRRYDNSIQQAKACCTDKLKHVLREFHKNSLFLPKTTSTMLRLTLILLFCSTLTLVFSQSQRAEQLRKNVVAISARGEKGFGFITGERNGELFIVTAAHVVENALADRQPVELKFFEDYKKYEANVIRHNPGIDIALLAVKKPDYFSWEENCLGDIQIDAPVGFVGKNGEWYFPKGPALGIVNDLDIPLNLIKVDINSISQGSSGAPLISEGGIVGMVLRTDGITAEAVDLKWIAENPF